MSDERLVAVYDTIAKAQDAVRTLQEAPFPSDQISLVSQKLGNHPQAAHDLELGDDSVRDAAIGAGLGGAAGLLAGLAFVAASSVGVFLLGPLALVSAEHVLAETGALELHVHATSDEDVQEVRA